MANRKSRTAPFLLPGKQWLARASLLMLLVFCITLMVMSKTGNPAVLRLRTQITDIAAPLLSVASSPMGAVHNAGTWFDEILHMRAENVALKNENIELLKWQAAAKEMQAENQSLRSLLHVVPARKTSFVTARIVSDLAGPYVHSALINGGSAQGVKKDSAAISENGLLGRIVDVGDSSARILLLSDINSRVPVITERAREKSILVGNNTGLPTLSYLTVASKIKEGERVITSGDGGVFPAGIPVGVVTKVDTGGVTVQPFVDAASVEYVSVVDYR